MIFSTQMMDTAFRYFGKSFHKILAVNFAQDKFQPIKVDDEEWEALNEKDILFSEWLGEFIDNDCYPDDSMVFANIMEFDSTSSSAQTFYYRRRYEGKWHYTALSIIPGYDDWCFVFVKILEEWEDIMDPACNYGKFDVGLCKKQIKLMEKRMRVVEPSSFYSKELIDSAANTRIDFEGPIGYYSEDV